MEPILAWSLLLLLAAALLFVAELFIPSGGILGVFASLAAVCGIVLLFLVDSTFGLIALIVLLALVPVGLYAGIAIWPKTFIARMLTLEHSQKPLISGHATGHPAPASTLVDHQGHALTDLRPIGMCSIEGQRVECLSQAGVIPAGSKVQVVSHDGMQVKVRQLEA